MSQTSSSEDREQGVPIPGENFPPNPRLQERRNEENYHQEDEEEEEQKREHVSDDKGFGVLMGGLREIVEIMHTVDRHTVESVASGK
jgi:hypothetical protein